MDDLYQAVQHPLVAASLLGDRYITRIAEPGSPRYFQLQSFYVLYDENSRYWWTLIQAYAIPEMTRSTAAPPSAERLKKALEALERIRQDLEDRYGNSESSNSDET